MKTETYGVRSYQSKKKRQQEQEDVRRGPWTLDEDTLLNQCVRRHGEGRWNLLAKSAGLKRTGKSCRLRWLNYLKPDIKRGNLSPQEQLLILELHSKWGNRWSKIAAHLPGRTDNEIKNYWRTRVQRQARQMNMESNSQSFMDAIRCFYMPRAVQKIEQSSTSICSTMKSDPLSSHSPTKFSDNIRPSDLTVKTITSCSKNNSLSISDISEITHQPTESSADCNSTRITTVNFGGSSLVKEECQFVDSSSYDIGMPAMSTFSDCHMAEHDWFGHCVADDDIWELGELWQFRN